MPDRHTASRRVASAAQMVTLGQQLGAAARPGDVLLLEGDFGAGKTTFVQGLARGLDITDSVTSPSFVMKTQYKGRLPLYHVDLYRLERPDESLLDEMEEDFYDGGGVSAVEWPTTLPPRLTDDATRLHFEVLDETTRIVTLNTPASHLAEAFQDR